MKIGFDRLYQGPKINFLSFGTSKNPQNPENPRKKPENPDFWSLVPHSYPLRGGSMVGSTGRLLKSVVVAGKAAAVIFREDSRDPDLSQCPQWLVRTNNHRKYLTRDDSFKKGK